MKKIVTSIATYFLPALAFAQTNVITDANSVTAKLVDIGNTVIYLLVGLAIIYIIWNIVQYFIKGGDDDASRSKSGMNIVWGIVGLFVIISIWGLVNILTGTFRTTPTNQPIPNFGNSTGNGGIPVNQVPIVR